MHLRDIINSVKCIVRLVKNYYSRKRKGKNSGHLKWKLRTKRPKLRTLITRGISWKPCGSATESWWPMMPWVAGILIHSWQSTVPENGKVLEMKRIEEMKDSTIRKFRIKFRLRLSDSEVERVFEARTRKGALIKFKRDFKGCQMISCVPESHR